jgi:hypothetical protein
MRVIWALHNLAEADWPVPGDAFWLVDTPENRAIAQRLWKSGQFDPNSALFQPRDGTGDCTALLELFATIADHHPNWTEVRVPGDQPIRDCCAKLRDLGLRVAEEARTTVIRRA